MDGKRRKTRPVDRPSIANCSYYDKYGIRHYAYEEVGLGFTAAAAWSCLRKSWKGYKIAARNLDEDWKIVFAQRIVNMCRLLELEEPEFLELQYESTTGQAVAGEELQSYCPPGYLYTAGYSLDSGPNDYYYYYPSSSFGY